MHAVAVIDADEKVRLGGISSSVPWWSIGKTVLAIAALRLVEMGLLPLHAKLAGEPFTLAQLLRHEAGLPDYGGFAAYQADIDVGRSPWPVGQLLTALDAARPRYEPGTGWAYSNIGYLKVRMLIEATTGAPLDTTLRQQVFAPLGLATARLALQPADLADVEMGFRCSYHPGWVYHGLITGSVVDAASLLKKLIDGHILQPETFASMLEGRALPEYRSRTFPNPAYGLGLMLEADNPLAHPLGHRGVGPGSAMAVFALGKKSCAVWLAPAPNADQVVDLVYKQLGNDAQ